MSKRVSLSASDCPTKRKARVLTDYYPLKDKSADRLLEGGAQSYVNYVNFVNFDIVDSIIDYNLTIVDS